VNLGYRLPSFSCFFLIRLSSRLCSAALIGVTGVVPTQTIFGFLVIAVSFTTSGRDLVPFDELAIAAPVLRQEGPLHHCGCDFEPDC
jgi:hypothetical protein